MRLGSTKKVMSMGFDKIMRLSLDFLNKSFRRFNGIIIGFHLKIISMIKK